MAKKKDSRENPDEMYSFSDSDEILRLYKVVIATQQDMDSIYHLYKKYLVKNAAMYRTDCNCSISISKYYQKLLEWYSENSKLFS
jgi:hypothetical protein